MMVILKKHTEKLGELEVEVVVVEIKWGSEIAGVIVGQKIVTFLGRILL